MNIFPLPNRSGGLHCLCADMLEIEQNYVGYTLKQELLCFYYQIALDIMCVVVRNSPVPFSDALIHQAFPAVVHCTLKTDDNASMQVNTFFVCLLCHEISVIDINIDHLEAVTQFYSSKQLPASNSPWCDGRKNILLP